MFLPCQQFSWPARDFGTCWAERRWVTAGLQVLGKPYDEASLYRVAGVLEQAAALPPRQPAGQEVQNEPACNRTHR